MRRGAATPARSPALPPPPACWFQLLTTAYRRPADGMAHPDVEEQAPAEPAVAPDHSDGTDSEAQELRDATNPDKQPAPFDAPFAPLSPPFVFWLDSVLIVLLGGFLGALGYGYLQAITEATTDGWISADGNAGYPSDPASLRFGAGRAWWVGLCAGAGLVIGLTRTALDLETAPSFITELRELHVDPWLGLRSATVTLMSLVAGAPMGPEAGLGALSGLLGTLVGRWRPLKVQPDVRRRLYVLSAMCSAFATVLPNPFIALMLCMELGRPLDGGRMGTTTYPELASLLTLGATVSYVVYFAISGTLHRDAVACLPGLHAPRAAIEGQVSGTTLGRRHQLPAAPVPLPRRQQLLPAHHCARLPGGQGAMGAGWVKGGGPCAEQQEAGTHGGRYALRAPHIGRCRPCCGPRTRQVGYDSLYITYGLAFGVMGALYGLVYVLIAGVLKRLVGVVRARLDAAIGRWPRVVVLATLGGAGYGALGWAMPLVLTDGAGSLGTVALQGAEIGTGVLAASAFTKTLAYHLAFE